jgi:hypothetical protein
MHMLAEQHLPCTVVAAETPIMFDQSPIEERHAAVGVFTAIALAGAGALHLLITGGFAPLTPRIERSGAAQTVQLVRVVDAEWAPPAYASDTRVTPTSYVPEDFGPEDVGAIDEPLAGATGAESYDRTQDEIAADIEALYAEAETYTADISYSDEVAYEVTSEKGASLSVSENASPW